MAISIGHWPGIDWRIRGRLVSTGLEIRTHRPPGIIRCIYRHILLGALRHPCETAFAGTRVDPQLRSDQPDHVRAVLSAHNSIWKNWHPASYRIASEFDPDRLRRDLHHTRACLLLCVHPRDRR